MAKSLTMPLHLIRIDNQKYIKMSTCGELAIECELTLDLSKTLLKLITAITVRLPRQ